MKKGRLEAFSDGVIAVIITIMVLDLKSPQGTQLSALRPVLPVFLCYVLSFLYVGIYWNNHHHLLQATERVSGGVLWANLHLLFWLSLEPFATAWMGNNLHAPWPVAAYGIVLLFAAFAYFILTRALLAHPGSNTRLRDSVGNDLKGKLSLLAYIAGIAASFYAPWLALSLYVLVALMWLKPDRRIERVLERQPAEEA